MTMELLLPSLNSISGGTGSVTMQGGFGKDVFQFINGDASNALIVDFSDTKGDSLNLKGFAADELLDAGLAHRGEDGRVTAFYRQRVLIPIRDEHSHICSG